jgi:mannan endo-1,4-beta-mannosidase
MPLLFCAVFAAMSGTLAFFSAGAAESRISPLFGFAIDGLPTASKLMTLREDTEIRPRIVVFYLQWPSDPDGRVFPDEALRSIEKSEAVPVLTWEPMFFDSDKGESMVPAESITGGKFDAYLQWFARESRLFGKPFLIRFAHEMNLVRYHWGSSREDFGASSASKYRAMFRHIVSVFRAEKVDNVRWVFCANADSVPAGPSNRISSYYPGDDVVDIVGLDGYNWGTTQTLLANGWVSKWRSFESIFAEPFQELRRVANGKPMAVFETGSAPGVGNKEEWILEALETARALQLAGVVWFEVNKEIDWRLEKNVSKAVLKSIDRENPSIRCAGMLLGN